MDMINFLKTHTKINNDFIDDFFGLYNSKDKHNFSIDLENVAKWMGSNKSDLKDTLWYSYKEGIDYTIKKSKPTGLRGKPKEIILLTPKCFKLMAMQSRTKKAVQVREYYYELEQVIDQYKEYIISGLQEKITALENNQKPKINRSKGVIYIIETADGVGHYKVGRTVDLKHRLNSYNGDKKNDIIPIFIYETNDVDTVEKCVKMYAKKFQYRKYKEVYKADINMLKELINDCAEFNDKTNLKMKWKSAHQDGGNYYVAVMRE